MEHNQVLHLLLHMLQWVVYSLVEEEAIYRFLGIIFLINQSVKTVQVRILIIKLIIHYCKHKPPVEEVAPNFLMLLNQSCNLTSGKFQVNTHFIPLMNQLMARKKDQPRRFTVTTASLVWELITLSVIRRKISNCQLWSTPAELCLHKMLSLLPNQVWLEVWEISIATVSHQSLTMEQTSRHLLGLLLLGMWERIIRIKLHLMESRTWI